MRWFKRFRNCRCTLKATVACCSFSTADRAYSCTRQWPIQPIKSSLPQLLDDRSTKFLLATDHHPHQANHLRRQIEGGSKKPIFSNRRQVPSSQQANQTFCTLSTAMRMSFLQPRTGPIEPPCQSSLLAASRRPIEGAFSYISSSLLQPITGPIKLIKPSAASRRPIEGASSCIRWQAPWPPSLPWKSGTPAVPELPNPPKVRTTPPLKHKGWEVGGSRTGWRREVWHVNMKRFDTSRSLCLTRQDQKGWHVKSQAWHVKINRFDTSTFMGLTRQDQSSAGNSSDLWCRTWRKKKKKRNCKCVVSILEERRTKINKLQTYDVEMTEKRYRKKKNSRLGVDNIFLVNYCIRRHVK